MKKREKLSLISKCKDILLIALVLVMITTSSVWADSVVDLSTDVLAGREYPLGDVNYDGNIDLTDTTIILRAALKIEKLNEKDIEAADLSFNGIIDMYDAVLSLKMALKLRFKTIYDYVHSYAMQAGIAQLKAELEGSELDIDIEAEGDTLVYKYTYKYIESKYFDDDIVWYLENSLEQSSSNYETVIASLKVETYVKEPSVKVMFMSSDGKVIVEKVFKSN